MRRNRRLHWFWRTLPAIVVGWLYGLVAISFLEDPHENMAELLHSFLPRHPFFERFAISLAYFVPALLVAFAAFGLLSRLFAPPGQDAETRCRHCHYILRGITEPRCPECGEPI